ncbi:MAG: hypothetical protein M3276_09610 [Actinomycetota bacterium]|nr:hypothetical protein [Actinomycetota bacterium]
MAANNTRRAIEITQQIEAQLKQNLTQKPAGPAASGRLAKKEPVSGNLSPVVPLRRPARSTSSARQTVTAALGEIGVPARARLVADYCEARFGERIDTRAFSTLRRDERRAWASKSSRPTYIVPALEGRFFQPIRGLLALSDWPIERRLIGPWSERADHLAATIQLARQLAWITERDAEHAKRLASIVAGMSRSVAGALEGREVEPARVQAAAEDELREVAEQDVPWRSEAAARGRQQLSAEEQLWGSRVRVVAEER